MANSINIYTVTAAQETSRQFAINFTLGYLSRDHVVVFVDGEVDGGDNQIFRTFTFVNDALVQLDDPILENEVVNVRRDTPSNLLFHDFQAGAIINEQGLDDAHLQTIMLVHEVFDGRNISEFTEDLNLNGKFINNMADPELAQDAATKSYVDNNKGTWRGDWVTATAYNVTDIIRDPVTLSIYIATAAHTSGVFVDDSANWDKIIDFADAADSAGVRDLRYGPIFATAASMKVASPVAVDAVAVTLTAGMRVSTLGYYDGWAATAEPQGAADYDVATLASVRTAKSDGAWVPDEQGDHTAANGLVLMIRAGVDRWISQFGAKPGVGNAATLPIQAAIDYGPGIVRIAANSYFPESTIQLKIGVILRGSTSQNTILDGSDMVSGAIVQVTGGAANFLAGGGIYDLQMSNGPSHGFHVDNTVGGGVGETFYIDRVAAYGNAGDGFLFEGDSTPLQIGHISPHGNLAGVRFKGASESHVQVLYIAADENTEAMCTIDGAGSNASIDILGWKSERRSAAGHPNIFRILNAAGGSIHIGSGQYTLNAEPIAGNAVVKVESGSDVKLIIDPITKNGAGGDYTFGLENVINGVDRTTAQLLSARYSTVNEQVDPAASGGSSSYRLNRHSFGSTPTANTLRINHSGDGALSNPNIEFYNDTTLIAKIANSGTVSLGGALRLGNVSTGPLIIAGSGSPEGAITAVIGSLFMRTDGGASTTFYVKESGTGNTGWVAK